MDRQESIERSLNVPLVMYVFLLSYPVASWTFSSSGALLRLLLLLLLLLTDQVVDRCARSRCAGAKRQEVRPTQSFFSLVHNAAQAAAPTTGVASSGQRLSSAKPPEASQ